MEERAGPRSADCALMHAYNSVGSYGYAPRLRYSRNYACSPDDRATRTYAYDTRGVRRNHRSTSVDNTGLQDRAVTRRGFAFGAEPDGQPHK